MKELIDLSQKAATFQGISSILGWDQETYMPNGAQESRAQQLKLLSGVIHDLKTSKSFKDALEKQIDLKSGVIKNKNLSEEEQSAVRAWRDDFIKDTALSTAFVEEFSELTSNATNVWREAREKNSFKLFSPYLEKIIDLSRKKAEMLGYEESPYDALLNLYEPKLKASKVKTLFSSIEKPLVELLKKIKNPNVTFNQTLSQEEQLKLSQEILNKIGYDLNFGRLDLSTHPFSSASHPTDSRITTRIMVDRPLSNILTVLHEAGHALYEMGLPKEKWGTPLAESISLGIHESQSRFWETRIGLSKPFWQWAAPKFNENADTLYNYINQVTPSLIRVEADEVTYPLHVILRFNLEKDLIEGKLKVKDVPEAWNAGMQKLLGITPETDREGCLQDIHWAMGGFGYFPTYLLGTLYASQLFDKFSFDHQDWEQKVGKGEFEFIKQWLKEKIHRHGRRYGPEEMIEVASGKPFSSEPFLNYLNQKYLTKKS